ncbi:MAG TPA: acetate uptake transporter [Terriglobales bacterium]|nr:acetate uptake transporter [Terriglobales bacterium]
MAEERPALSVADPAPLGLAAFALTTFILSATNAFGLTTAPIFAVMGFALFYGGAAQFAAGMWEFRNRNVFGATAFSTYGGFWLGVGVLLILLVTGKVAGKDLSQSLGWILLAFAIFNTYMLIWASRINLAVFAVFLTLEITEILLFIGNFAGSAPGAGLVAVGGYVGLLTALVAWYTSAAGVINGMSSRPVLPVGTPLWGETAAAGRAVEA